MQNSCDTSEKEQSKVQEILLDCLGGGGLAVILPTVVPRVPTFMSRIVDHIYNGKSNS